MSQNVISGRKREFMNCLLAGETVALASEKAGITIRTGFRWQAEPAFQEVYSKAETRLLDSACRKLESKALAAVEALCDVLENPAGRGSNVKRLTAVSLLELVLRMKETLDFEARIAALEKR